MTNLCKVLNHLHDKGIDPRDVIPVSEINLFEKVEGATLIEDCFKNLPYEAFSGLMGEEERRSVMNRLGMPLAENFRSVALFLRDCSSWFAQEFTPQDGERIVAKAVNALVGSSGRSRFEVNRFVAEDVEMFWQVMDDAFGEGFSKGAIIKELRERYAQAISFSNLLSAYRCGGVLFEGLKDYLAERGMKGCDIRVPEKEGSFMVQVLKDFNENQTSLEDLQFLLDFCKMGAFDKVSFNWINALLQVSANEVPWLKKDVVQKLLQEPTFEPLKWLRDEPDKPLAETVGSINLIGYDLYDNAVKGLLKLSAVELLALRKLIPEFQQVGSWAKDSFFLKKLMDGTEFLETVLTEDQLHIEKKDLKESQWKNLSEVALSLSEASGSVLDLHPNQADELRAWVEGEMLKGLLAEDRPSRKITRKI